MAMLFLQHRHQRCLSIAGFFVTICSITVCVHLWLYHHTRPINIDVKAGKARQVVSFPQVRPNVENLRFRSSAVESVILEIERKIKNKELAWLFGNCFPNTLDTAVDFNATSAIGNRPDTFVSIGSLGVMSLRDSSIQMNPYLPLMRRDRRLRRLIEGVLLRQCLCIQRDPYGSTYYKDLNQASEWKQRDETEMFDGVHERKWELDSLCYFLRLLHSYWKEVDREATFFLDYKDELKRTIAIVLKTMKDQRRYNGIGPYTYQRNGQPPDPRGYQAKPNGLIYSYFRPSEELQTYPYFIPSQYFAHHSLTLLSELVKHLNWTNSFADDIFVLTSDLHSVLLDDYTINGRETSVTTRHNRYGLIYSYEINGVGDIYLMDEASTPSLLSLPYLCPRLISLNSTTYQNTRTFVLSYDNPMFYSGDVLQGVGGQHTGKGMVWPIGIIMRGLTSNNDSEIRLCLKMLLRSHGNTGFMHESVHKDDMEQYTRAWFPSANSLFGEFIWKLYREKPYLLNEIHTQ